MLWNEKNIKCKWHITSLKYLKIRLKYDERREILFNRNYIVSNHVLDFKEMIAIGKLLNVSHEIWEVVIKGNKKRKEELKKKNRENEEVF